MLCEYDASGTVKKKYVYALGKCIATIDSVGGKTFNIHDAQGSVKLITNAAGTIVKSYSYYPFGDSLNFTGSFSNDLRYTEQRYVDGLDAYDYNARYYDQDLGRFYGIDPIYSPAISPYAYCDNDPVNNTDPTGMETANVRPRFDFLSWEAAGGGGRGGGSGWTDASGAGWDEAMKAPSKTYLENNLAYAAAHPNEAAAIAKQLSKEGYTVIITRITLLNGEVNGMSQEIFTELCTQLADAGMSDVGDPALKDAGINALKIYTLTDAGEKAAMWYAGKYNETGQFKYALGGCAASLWTPKTAPWTAATLSLAWSMRNADWSFKNDSQGRHGHTFLDFGDAFRIDYHPIGKGAENAYRWHIDALWGLLKHWPH